MLVAMTYLQVRQPYLDCFWPNIRIRLDPVVSSIIVPFLSVMVTIVTS